MSSPTAREQTGQSNRSNSSGRNSLSRRPIPTPCETQAIVPSQNSAAREQSGQSSRPNSSDRNSSSARSIPTARETQGPIAGSQNLGARERPASRQHDRRIDFNQEIENVSRGRHPAARERQSLLRTISSATNNRRVVRIDFKKYLNNYF